MFRVDDREISFVLFEYLKAENLLKLPAYAEMDKETFDILLDSAYKLAKDVLAPVNLTGDKEGCSIDGEGNVTTPKGFKEAYNAYCEGGWIGLSTPEEFGGIGAPQVLGLAASEAFTGAACALAMYPGLTHGAAALIMDEGSDEQKAMYVERMISGEWGGTMCLTESGAGSAVGDSKTTATKIRDGYYSIVGQKIFISSGDNDLVSNNIHLVLARTPDAPVGIKGLSLFIVPKFRVNEDGSNGEANDATCIGIEHKMGINGSATCTMSFGDSGNCEGWLIGNEGDGIKIMFHMMNEARIGVGLMSLGLAASSYNEALDYSRERIQGVDMKNFKDPNAPRVAIIEHPDVRRMLMTMKAYTTGLRALMMKASMCVDYAWFGEGEEKQKAQDMLDFITPLCKGYGSDVAMEACNLAVQTLGGYGYTQEYPCEQYMRDCKIMAIYEGTNGIQAMDLVGRKMGAKGGALFMGFMGEIMNFVSKAKENDITKGYIGELEQSLNDMQTLAMTFMQKNMEGKTSYVLQQATSFMKFAGNITFAWLLGDMAIEAGDKLNAIFADKGADTDEAKAAIIADSDEAAFYDGKIKTAEFFCKNLLPENSFLLKAMTNEDTSLMDIRF